MWRFPDKLSKIQFVRKEAGSHGQVEDSESPPLGDNHSKIGGGIQIAAWAACNIEIVRTWSDVFLRVFARICRCLIRLI